MTNSSNYSELTAFPSQLLKPGVSSVAWKYSEIIEWIDSRVQARDEIA